VDRRVRPMDRALCSMDRKLRSVHGKLCSMDGKLLSAAGWGLGGWFFGTAAGARIRAAPVRKRLRRLALEERESSKTDRAACGDRAPCFRGVCLRNRSLTVAALIHMGCTLNSRRTTVRRAEE
jgi:hypothetical protein